MPHTEEQLLRIEASRQAAALRRQQTLARQRQAQGNAAPVNQTGSRSLDFLEGGPRNVNYTTNNGAAPSGAYPFLQSASSGSVGASAAPPVRVNANVPMVSRAPSFPLRNATFPVPASSVGGAQNASVMRPRVSASVPPTAQNCPQPSAQPRPALSVVRITAKASLLPKGRFQVTSPYSPQLTEFCKRFKTRNYNPTDRSWSFNLSDYNTFDKTIQSELKVYIIWEGLPKFIQEAFVKGKFAQKTENVDLSDRIPPTLLNSLLPYQVEGVRFAVRNSGRLLLADDMGLGKTIQSIATASYFQEFPILCVAPSSMRFEWKEQWKRWCPGLKEVEIQVLTTSRQVDSSTSAKIVIVTYDLLSSIQKQLIRIGFPTVICDESHALKSYKAARTKATMEICKSAKHIILLSGTPALSRPSELYSQLEIIDKSLFKSFPEFGRRYCDGHMSARGFMDYNGKSNTEELQIVLESTVMIRRLKKDVASELPEKSRKVVLLDPDMVQLSTTELSDSENHYKQRTRSNNASHQEVRRCLLNYFQQTGKAKTPAVIQYLQQILEDNETLKVVIFAHHTYVINELFSTLSETYRGIRIDGSTDPQDRKVLCDTFQQDDNCRIAVLSITACSTGLTLTAASVVVFAELYWNPGILAQAEDRLHRLGQRNNVTVLYLIAKNTADEPIWTMLKRKLEFLNDVGLSKDDYNNVSTEKQETLLPANLSWEQFLGDEGNWNPCGLASDDGPSSKRMKTDDNNDKL